ncbi:MAG: tetratricopeptide repeat protein [Chitinophagales bacterium]
MSINSNAQIHLSDPTFLDRKRLNYLVSIIQTKIFQVSKKIELPFQEAFALADKLKESETLAALQIYHAKYFQQIGDYDSAWIELEKAKGFYTNTNHQKGLGETFNRFAVLEYLKGNYQQSFDLSEKSLKIGEEVNHPKGVIDSLNLMGSIYKEQGKFDKALEFFFTALKTAEQIKDTEMQGNLYNNIGIIYQVQKNYPKALTFLEQGLEKHQLLRHNIKVMGSLNNIGAIHMQLDEYPKALDYFDKILVIIESKAICIEQEAIVLINVAAIYSKQKKFEKAIRYGQKALKISKKLNTPIYEISSLNNLAITHLDMEQYSKALDYVSQSEKLALEKKGTAALLVVYDSYIRCYEGLKCYEKAVVYYKKLLQIKDQQYNEDKATAIAELSIQYETEQKEKEIQLHKLDLEKKELEIQRKQDVEKMNRQLEQMVEKRTQQLRIQNKQLKQYAFIVAHDLKEPLCNLSGVADLLHKSYRHQLEPIAQNFLQHITHSTNYMNRLLEDLLIYATLDRGFDENQPTACIIEALEEAKKELKGDIIGSNAKIVMENMPKKLKISRKHLILLLQNLLSNSLQFHRKNVATLIQIKIQKKPDFYQIEVSDNGIGIAPENQQKIFNIFHRLDKANYKGTGIGLAICDKIVHLYGGQISVKSTLNKGSVFYFTLPR